MGVKPGLAAQLMLDMEKKINEQHMRIAELERENQSMRADWKAICDAAESVPAGTVEFQLRQRIAELEKAIRWALGEEGEFGDEPPPLAGKCRRRYWWRTELRKRSGL